MQAPEELEEQSKSAEERTCQYMKVRHIEKQRILRSGINRWRNLINRPDWQHVYISNLNEGRAISGRGLGTTANEQVQIEQLDQFGNCIYSLESHRNILHHILQKHIKGETYEAKVSVDIKPWSTNN